ncbi:MAG TPA: hypothetical protein VFW12_02000 [Candidatus Limnocylindria bacterium]|nr:hypothetical protein [Candidatus Limnocylindria bacterium]
MVDALRSVHRVVRRGGTLVDVRPGTARVPRLEHGGRVYARLAPTDHTRHHAADDAIARLVAEGLFRPARGGHFWFRHTFPDRASLRAWLDERDDWAAPAVSLPSGPVTLRRAVEFTHYVKVR